MRRPGIRIGTLMSLVVIAALAIDLIGEKRRSHRVLAELQAELDGARMRADQLAYRVQVAEARAAQTQVEISTR